MFIGAFGALVGLNQWYQTGKQTEIALKIELNDLEYTEVHAMVRFVPVLPARAQRRGACRVPEDLPHFEGDRRFTVFGDGDAHGTHAANVVGSAGFRALERMRRGFSRMAPWGTRRR
mgnify:CR=1 FL=1